jgi:hypothetical protein
MKDIANNECEVIDGGSWCLGYSGIAAVGVVTKTYVSYCIGISYDW